MEESSSCESLGAGRPAAVGRPPSGDSLSSSKGGGLLGRQEGCKEHPWCCTPRGARCVPGWALV
uniref:Uncharacterized protein n=1 Tax=Anas platyrhynchos TaxID=8839 RepID=A0A8B9SIA6_ANAPL